MDNKEIQIRILAQAVYELRLLLSHHLGSNDEETKCEAISAHLAYAIHNEALAIIENRPADFNVNEAVNKILRVEELYNEKFSFRFEDLVKTET